MRSAVALLLSTAFVHGGCDWPGCGDEVCARVDVEVDAARLAPDTALATSDAPPPVLHTALPPEMAVFDLGALAMADGVSGDILVDVDSDVRSFTLQVSAHDGVAVVVDRALAAGGAADGTPDGSPGGLVVVESEADDASRQAVRLSRGFAGPFLSPHRVTPKVGGGAFVFPATSAVPLGTGTWRLRFRQAAVDIDASGDVTQQPVSRPLRVVALLDRRLPTPPRLNVSLHLTGAGGLDAINGVANPTGDARVQEAADTLRRTFAAAGINLVVIGSHDVVDAAGNASFSDVSLAPGFCDDGDLLALWPALVPAPGSVDVVIVDRLRCVVRGAEVDGFAGVAAVPGDVFVEGGAHGGVVVALGAITDAVDDTSQGTSDDDAVGEALGVAMAHELGHLLGLFHTVEAASGADPLIFDIIDDTPEGFDDDNLMRFDPRGSTALTAGQAAVLRTSPWVR